MWINGQPGLASFVRLESLWWIFLFSAWEHKKIISAWKFVIETDEFGKN